eukprot:scaffold139965_cov20-Prasinocladus_malaysianus.AAC.1
MPRPRVGASKSGRSVPGTRMAKHWQIAGQPPPVLVLVANRSSRVPTGWWLTGYGQEREPLSRAPSPIASDNEHAHNKQHNIATSTRTATPS